MARNKVNNPKTAKAQALAKTKDARAKAKKVLANLGMERKEFQKALSNLKKSGVIKSTTDLRSQKPTRYMASRIKEFKDVASGRALAIRKEKIKPEVLEAYIKQGTAQVRGKHVVRAKHHPREKLGVENGLLKSITPLKNGQTMVLYLPFSARNFNEYLAMLKDNTHEINAMKGGTEQFGFQLYGHNSLVGEPDIEHLIEYIERRYQHILNNARASRELFAEQEFVLYRFKTNKGRSYAPPYLGEKKYHMNKKGRDESRYRYEKRIADQRHLQRQRRYLERETEGEREKRLAKQRERDRKNYWKKREKEIGKKLLEQKIPPRKKPKNGKRN